MNKIKIILYFLTYMMTAACASNAKSNGSSYSCYSEYSRIGEERLIQNKMHSAQLIRIIEKIQLNRVVGFNDSVSIYKEFEGSSETRKIDEQISEIDKRSGELNKLVKANSGEDACEERMWLEAERYRLARLKFDAISRSF